MNTVKPQIHRESLQRKRHRGLLRRKRMLPIAVSCYSGSTERCGDSYGWAMLSDGRTAVALSDGTGKGEAAARDSRQAVNAVLGLLRADTDPELTLRILNLIISMDNRKEKFPTMDLALFDPESRELKIYKVGAAPTVIVRAPRCRPVSGVNAECAGAGGVVNGPGPAGCTPPDKIEILTAPAVPMGVSGYSEIHCVSTLAMPGDRIIMITDGITDSCRDDCNMLWLQRLLKRIKSRNLQTICDLIIREADLNYGNREKDDMTIAIFCV